MPVQKRNPDAVGLLSADLLSADEFNYSGIHILTIARSMHRDGGGRLMLGWLGDNGMLYTPGGSVVMNEISVADANYAATINGGPYVALDGANDFLILNDAAWQEPGANTFLVWTWFRFSAVMANFQICVGKYDGGVNCSWMLYWHNVSQLFAFLTNQTGNFANNVIVQTTHTVAPNTWYFAAGYFQPSTLMRIYVGEPNDAALTIDSLAVGIPASCFNGVADLCIGGVWFGGIWPAGWPGWFWNGRLGLIHARTNVPAATVDSYVTRAFHLTRRLYLA